MADSEKIDPGRFASSLMRELQADDVNHNSNSKKLIFILEFGFFLIFDCMFYQNITAKNF
ncbi:hypothetical protein BpHYR1_052105 [Brachionus plicatilis]|uniref:Uncharacterized protein n=1 Tax=Brachionus plicatilis TaxID=10195 RepID=A0A3M7RPF7_BRAPC|nr:hypothetical protein BpHYR1_052105 [Brachionus plicatilis]